MTDYLVENHGSIFLLQPLNRDARVWLLDHVEPSAQWFGGALAVEHRFIHPLVQELTDEGFTVR